MSGGWASWFTEVYCIMFITQLVYISSPLHLNLKDHCTNWRTLNKGSGQNLWPFKFFISIFVVLVLLFSLTFYNFHGQNYLNALKISIYGTVNNVYNLHGAQCHSSQRKSSYTQVKEAGTVSFNIYSKICKLFKSHENMHLPSWTCMCRT